MGPSQAEFAWHRWSAVQAPFEDRFLLSRGEWTDSLAEARFIEDNNGPGRVRMLLAWCRFQFEQVTKALATLVAVRREMSTFRFFFLPFTVQEIIVGTYDLDGHGSVASDI